MAVDALSRLLNDVHADGALFGQSVMRPPWSVCFADAAPLTMVVMIQGEGWIAADDDVPVALRVGDVAIVVGEAPFSIVDGPGTHGPARYTVHGPDLCTTGDGREIQADLKLGVRACDEPGDGSVVVLTGS